MSKASTAASNGFEPPPYLNILIAAVNDGARAAQGGAFLFLLVGLYLLGTAFALSDEGLLLGRMVMISQIGAALPISFSFAIAPMVFVFLHGYTLVRYDMLGANIRQFHREVQQTVNIESDRERCRQLLANVEFVEALTTPRSSAQYTRLWPLLFLGIVVVFPVVVLLLVQINTLRYQNDLITNVQRVWLVLDLAVLVWFFARSPLYTAGEGRARPWRQRVRLGLWIGLATLLIGLNFFWLRSPPPTSDPGLIQNPQFSLARLVWQPLDVACLRLDWGCRFLLVNHRTLVDKVWDDKAMPFLRLTNLNTQTPNPLGTEPEKLLVDIKGATAGVEGVFLRGRSLRFAILSESQLYAADLIDADLTGASLDSTGLMGAKMMGSNLSRADLSFANLANANLAYANLSGANLAYALLDGAVLQDADLRGAKYSAGTLFPPNFDPKAAKMVLIGDHP